MPGWRHGSGHHVGWHTRPTRRDASPCCFPAQAAEAAEAQAWVDAARATPSGEKKTLPAEMPKGYVPKAVEASW